MADLQDLKSAVRNSVIGLPPDNDNLQWDYDVEGAFSHTPISVVVVGGYEVNKAGFVAEFVGRSIIASNPTAPCTKVITIGKETYHVSVDTNAGQECFWGFFDPSIRQADGFIFLYKYSSKESFKVFARERQLILQHKQVDKVPLLIVGIKDSEDDMSSDIGVISDSRVSAEDGKKLSENFGCIFRQYEPSKDNIDDIFTALVQNILNSRAGHFGKSSRLADFSTILEFVVCGDTFVGKTAFVHKITTGDFEPKYIATLDPQTHKHELVTESGESVLLKLTDTSGLSFLADCTRDSLINVHGFILMYSVSSISSFLYIEQLRKAILNCKPDAAKLVMMIVATKTDDIINRYVSTQEGVMLAKRLGCMFCELSLKDNTTDSSKITTATVLPLAQEVIRQHKLEGVQVELEKKGLLYKLKRFGAWKPGYIVTLSEGSITWSSEKEKSKGKQSKNNKIILDETTVIQVGVVVDGKSRIPDNKSKEMNYPFTITTQSKHICLATSTDQDRDLWVSALKAHTAVEDIANTLLDDVIRGMLWDEVQPTGPRQRPTRSVSQAQFRHSHGADGYSGDRDPSRTLKLFSELHSHSFHGQFPTSGSKVDEYKTLRRTATGLDGERVTARERSMTLKERTIKKMTQAYKRSSINFSLSPTKGGSPTGEKERVQQNPLYNPGASPATSPGTSPVSSPLRQTGLHKPTSPHDESACTAAKKPAA